MSQNRFALSSLFVAAVVIVGCGGVEPLSMVVKKPVQHNPQDLVETTDTYIVEVLQPPPEGGEFRLTAYRKYRGLTFSETVKSVGGKPNLFTVQIPTDQLEGVYFVPWTVFPDGHCHDSKEEIYCGPLRLFTNSSYYTLQGVDWVKPADMKEVVVVLKALMSNAVNSSTAPLRSNTPAMTGPKLWKAARSRGNRTSVNTLHLIR